MLDNNLRNGNKNEHHWETNSKYNGIRKNISTHWNVDETAKYLVFGIFFRKVLLQNLDTFLMTQNVIS